MKKNRIFIALLAFTLFSCSSDDETLPATEMEVVTSLLKSRIYTNLPEEAPNYDEFYSYDNGLLNVAGGFTTFAGNYTYNAQGLLTNLDSYEDFTFQYDAQGRITKRLEVGTPNYIQLFYDEPNKVITHKYYEFGGGTESRLERRELLLDEDGRIVKMTDLDPDETSIDIDYQIYEYNSLGNIIKITTKYTDYTALEVRTINYTSIKNPYYYAFRKYYSSQYYLENFIGLSVMDSNGICPFIISSTENMDTYTTNADNLPKTLTRVTPFGNTYIIEYDYY